MPELWVTRQAAEVAGKKAPAQSVVPSYLPELLQVFAHNWATVFRLRSRWFTDVTIAHSGVEERWALADRPYRSMLIRATAFSPQDTASLEQILARQLHQRLMAPLHSDFVMLTAEASSSDTQLEVTSTAWKRFFPGARAVVHGFVGRSITSAEVVTIAGVSENIILLSSGLSMDHRQPSIVLPLVETEVRLDGQLQLINDATGDLQIELEEVDGPGALPAWIPNWDDPVADTYRQIPLLNIDPNWAKTVSLTARRVGESKLRGRASSTSVSGERPRLGFSWEFTNLDREAAHRTMRFIDSRMGRARHFWQVSLVRNHWSPAVLTTTHVTVSAYGRFDDLHRFFDYVALVYSDGTTLIREIADHQQVAGPAFRLVFSEPIPTTRALISDIVGCCPAHLVRLDSDDYEEVWSTDSTLEVGLATIEVPDRDVSISLYSDPVASIDIEDVPDLMLYLEPMVEVFTPLGAPINQTADDVGSWNDARPGENRFLETVVPPLAGYHRTIITGVGPIRFKNETADPNAIASMRLGSDENLWSNALGMTIFLGMQWRIEMQRAYTGLDYLVRIPNPADDGTDIFQWTLTEARFYEDLGIQNRDHWITTPFAAAPKGVPHLLCLTWKPGQYARIYTDGVLVGQAPRAVIDLPTAVIERPHFFHLANSVGDDQTLDDAWIAAVAVFRRALTVDELNEVGNAMTGVAGGASWKKVI